MNYIKAVISKIQSVDHISIVSFLPELSTHSAQMNRPEMKMMSLELDTALKVGSKVLLGVKSTNISIAKDISGLLSISNRLSCTIEHIRHGELLSSLKCRFMDTTLESIITRESAVRMNLQEADDVLVLIKSSELSIVEIL